MKKSKLIVMLLLVVCFITACNKNNQTFTVTFDSNDGVNVTSVEVYDGQMVSKPANPTRSGYTFLGWYLDEKEFDFSSKITKNITLLAKWSLDTSAVKMWKVMFNTDGGTPIDEVEVIDGGTLTLNNISTTKPGYTFLGWYSGDEKFDFSTKITKDITLTAKWEVVDTTTKYKVSFNTDGGSKVSTQTVAENGTATKPKNPTRSGYTFKGWYLGDTEYNFSTKVTKDITLTAKWEKNAPKYSYKWVDVEDSTEGERILYLTKDGVKIAGTADLTSQSGKTVTVNIPVTGLKIAYEIKSITNIKEN